MTQLSNNYSVKRRDAQPERKKSCATSRDSKNREIVERYSIKRTLLIELSWGKLRGEVTCEGHVVKDK